MTVTTPNIIEWGETELATAHIVLALHSKSRYGLCKCGRIWECHVHAQWLAYQRYWQARFAAMRVAPRPIALPTMLLPIVEPRPARCGKWLPGRGFSSARGNPGQG